jgi:hypothetical protein
MEKKRDLMNGHKSIEKRSNEQSQNDEKSDKMNGHKRIEKTKEIK